MSLDWILKFNEYLVSDEVFSLNTYLSLNNLLNSINKTDIFSLTEQNKRLINKNLANMLIADFLFCFCMCGLTRPGWTWL